MSLVLKNYLFSWGRLSGHGSWLDFLLGNSSEVEIFDQGGAILSDLALGALTITGDGRNRVGDHIAIAGTIRTATRQICFFDLDSRSSEMYIGSLSSSSSTTG